MGKDVLHTHTHRNITPPQKKKKKNHQNTEILPFVTTWMDQEDILLNETSQTKNYFCIHLFNIQDLLAK